MDQAISRGRQPRVEGEVLGPAGPGQATGGSQGGKRGWHEQGSKSAPLLLSWRGLSEGTHSAGKSLRAWRPVFTFCLCLPEMELAKGLQSLASAFKKTSTHEEPSVPTPETPAPSLEDDVAEGEGHHPDVEQQKQCLQALGETLLVNQQLLEKMEQQWQQAERQLQKEKAELFCLPCCEDTEHKEKEEAAEDEQLSACSTPSSGLRCWRMEMSRRLQSTRQLLQPAAWMRVLARLPAVTA
ncbi:rho GTPase-activating protein 45-like isoform X1 [Struthio camelus]|uniref:rho GTPase-activating protein 45-like isoform X1 n=1 Tax=Struthio camelus TaxID=8801 RepID=UPI003603CDCA